MLLDRSATNCRGTKFSPLSKRTREDGTRAKSRRCLDLADVSVLPEEVDKENSIPSAGISSLEDAMDSRTEIYLVKVNNSKPRL